MWSAGVCSRHIAGSAARIEKYIANSAAKNISSLESQTMVPTLTMLGLVSEWIRLFSIAEAAVRRSLLPVNEFAMRRVWPLVGCVVLVARGRRLLLAPPGLSS